jgi:dihydroneopterin aldolase
MAAPGRPDVVKLGGSLAYSAHLRDWIDALAACAGRAVIVPGGGPFADAVRAAQSAMGFDDKAAHHMALLAMEQYGRALASHSSLLSLADSEEAIRHALTTGQIPLWMPTRMVLDASEIAPSWDVTSDSLAAWLAGRIGAGRLFLIKHAQLRGECARLADLEAMNIVDPAFAEYFRASAVPAFILGPTDFAAAATAIRGSALAGMRVDA